MLDGSYGSSANSLDDLIRRVSSTIDTGSGNLENMPDKEFVRSTVGFAWINRDQTTRPDSRTTAEVLLQFEDIEEVKIYRSRIHAFFQRINEA